MRYLAAYLLLCQGPNKNPTVADIKKLLDTVGIDCDEAQAKLVVDQMKGKKIAELIADGTSKMASVPTGGAVAAAAAPAAGGDAPAEAKKEEKKEAPKEESDDEDMDFGLFD
eukprot:NODE_2043_length_664_cov_320.480447_g1993_i0.p2 GENE.NODE_2043_length_664_cov_320.480447_g1993_i0~~NODE_2043_length_664_cov_320.480447_g1993_i0.p2  ORF type:complete len:112 (-),score=56.26 NODE_2043_length_664_cov_320.480447_g1993_i0:104-439(-)